MACAVRSTAESNEADEIAEAGTPRFITTWSSCLQVWLFAKKNHITEKPILSSCGPRQNARYIVGVSSILL